MKTQCLIVAALALACSGCASGPYYYGGTGYRAHNIAGLPVSGSVSVNASQSGLMINPQLWVNPYYVGWKR